MKGRNIIHFIKCLLNLEHPVTQTTIEEQKALSRYAKQSKVILEIGIFEGFNTRQFALNSPADAIVYAIDPFFKGTLGICYGKLIAFNDWKKNKIKKIKVIKGLSSDVTTYVSEKIDFIFVDGDHSFEAVKKDLELYSKKLSENGVIAFHDARIFPNGWTKLEWGPVQVVDQIIRNNKEWKIIEEVDSTVFIQQAQ